MHALSHMCSAACCAIQADNDDDIKSVGSAVLLQDTDVLTAAMKEFGAEFPELMRPLIQERDEYMVFMLRLLASRCTFGRQSGQRIKCIAMHGRELARAIRAPVPMVAGVEWLC